jgi:hypothetical protein
VAPGVGARDDHIEELGCPERAGHLPEQAWPDAPGAAISRPHRAACPSQ